MGDSVKNVPVAGKIPVFLLLGVLIVVLYATSLDDPAVFDSMATVAVPPSSEQWVREGWSLGLSRSITTFSLDVMAHLFPNNVPVQRLLNVFLHVLNSWLVYLLFFKLFSVMLSGDSGQKRIRGYAILAALLFALHPISVYAVAYVIQRSILLALFFSLVAVLCYLKGFLENRWPWLLLSVPAYYLALHSKEHVILLPVVLVLLTVAISRMDRKNLAHFFVKHFYVFLLLFVLAVQTALTQASPIAGTVYEPTMGYLGDAPGSVAGSGVQAASISHLDSVFNQLQYFFYYLFLYFVPLQKFLSIDLQLPFIMNPIDIRLMAAGFFYVAGGLCLLWNIKKQGDRALASWGLLLPWVLFGTEFVVIRYAEAFVLYRAYLWMFGLPSLIPFLHRKLVESFPAMEKAAWLVALFVSAVFVLSTYAQLKTFSSSVAVWQDAVQKFESAGRKDVRSFRMYNNLSASLMQEGRAREAIPQLLKAIEANPGDYHARHNLGTAYLIMKDYGRAVEHLQKAITMSSVNREAIYNLAETYFRMRLLEKSGQYFLRAHEMKQNEALPLMRLAEIAIMQGDVGEGEKHLEQAIKNSADPLEVQRIRKILDEKKAKKN